MLLEFGEAWLNIDHMKSLYIDSDKKGDYACVIWADRKGLRLSDTEGAFDEIRLFDNQRAVIENVLRTRVERSLSEKFIET